MIYQH